MRRPAPAPPDHLAAGVVRALEQALVLLAGVRHDALDVLRRLADVVAVLLRVGARVRLRVGVRVRLRVGVGVGLRLRVRLGVRVRVLGSGATWMRPTEI